MQTTPAVPTIAECLQRAAALTGSSPTARLDVEVLLSAALNRSRTYLYTWPERQLSEVEQQRFEEYFSRRLRGEPVAYILGEKEFWSLSLKVNNSTLIPRPETELLVEYALQRLPSTAQTVADLGTGSGAIALALASERPQWQLLALDKFPGAVALAEENRNRLQLQNVRVLQSEWLAAVAAVEQFHLIVSNPPYIDTGDPHLDRDDVRFEPRTALVAAGQGLADIRQIARQAAVRLHPGGWLMVEHGFRQGGPVREIFAGLGYEQVATHTDLAGLERVTEGRRPVSLTIDN